MTTIVHKYNSTSGIVPAPAEMIPRELAINTADGKLYTKKTDGTIVEIGGTAGLGSMAFQDSTAVAITGGTISGVTVPTGTYSSNINESLMRSVRKASAGTITKGQVVYIVGSTGSHLTVELASSNTELLSSPTIGIAAETITSSQEGYMIVSGLLTGLSNVPTASFANGAALWLSSTAGVFTTTKPSRPEHLVFLGWVVNSSNGNNASIFVKIVNGFELSELHDVLSASEAEKDVLSFDATAQLWKNRSLVNAGIAPSGAQYVTMSADSGLSAERVLTAGDHVTVVDGGSTVTIDWLQNYRKRAMLFSEMNSAADWTNFATNGTNLFTTTGLNDGNRVGILTSGTGSVATGSAGIGNAEITAVVFGTREHRFTCVAKIPTLSTATETFRVNLGFHDNRTAALPTDGLYFSYIHSSTSGRWTCEGYTGGGTTGGSIDSGVTADTGWHTFEIIVNAAASSAVFKIDGTTVATRTTDIPTGTGQATTVSCYILKSVGTTARNLYIDMLALEVDVNR